MVALRPRYRLGRVLPQARRLRARWRPAPGACSPRVGLLAAALWALFAVVVIKKAFDEPLIDTEAKVIEAVIIAAALVGTLVAGQELACCARAPHRRRTLCGGSAIGLLLELLWFAGPYVLTLSARW